MITYSAVVFYPIFLMIITSFKDNKEIFTRPYSLPNSFNLDNFIKLIKLSNYERYFLNSIIVTVLSIFFILLVSSLASYAIAKYRFPADRFVYIYLLLLLRFY